MRKKNDEKTIYFIRHGETMDNLLKLRNSPEEDLSPHGVKQARHMAKRFKNLPIEKIISSDLPRTRKTAREIEKITKRPIIASKIFEEVRRPSSTFGLSLSHPKVVDSMRKFEKHADDKNWHYEDEENFREVVNRAQKALVHLSERPEDALALVTHAHFFQYMVTVMILGKNIKYKDYEMIRSRVSQVDNASISKIVYKEKKWKIKIYNDTTHLSNVK